MLGPRKDFLSWDELWMATAELISKRSKDPNTQCGAVIVDKNNHIVGVGYNGFPRGCNSNKFPWDREGDFLDTKYPYVCHAEANAIDNSDRHRLEGSTMYANLFPCNECAKRIVQNGITTVIYLSDQYHDLPETEVARRLFDLADIDTHRFKGDPKHLQIEIDLTIGK